MKLLLGKTSYMALTKADITKKGGSAQNMQQLRVLHTSVSLKV